MNSRVFVRLISIFLALIGSIVLGWYRLPWLLGTAQAYLSLQQGRYVSLSYGMPFREYPEYQRFLKSKFDVEDRTIAGCVVMESLLAYADAYNRVSREAVKRKFGRDVFSESWSHAIAIERRPRGLL